MKSSTINRENCLEEFETPHESSPKKSNLDGDRSNLLVLIILYVIQGLVIGFSTTLPIILQSRIIVTYEDQALYSVVLWPHNMKVLWAPLVDTLYVQRIGKRKCWLIPLQLLMVTLLLYTANKIEEWLPEYGKPNFKMIILVVFVINLLSATHDIVVDGWALTMLKKMNVNYASTCNSVGVPIGIFISNLCFTLMVSEKFRNKMHLQSTFGPEGLITMKSFLYFWAFVVLSIAFFVGIFKKETRILEDDYAKISVLHNYKLIWSILKLPGIKVLTIALMTAMIGFTATESVSRLKFIDAGVSKDDMMIVSHTMLIGVKLLLPVFVSKYITSSNPICYYLKMTPLRLLWGIVFAILIYFTPRLIRDNGQINVPVYYYLALAFIYIINEILSFFMLLTLFAFFCQISDPRFGGTYMTLFSTLFFIGWTVPNTLVLKLVDGLTFSKCSSDDQNTCITQDLINTCKTSGGQCVTYIDGYYIALAMCTVFGFIWYGVFKNVISRYQSLGLFNYVVHNHQTNPEMAKEPCIMSPT